MLRVFLKLLLVVQPQAELRFWFKENVIRKCKNGLET